MSSCRGRGLEKTGARDGEDEGMKIKVGPSLSRFPSRLSSLSSFASFSPLESHKSQCSYSLLHPPTPSHCTRADPIRLPPLPPILPFVTTHLFTSPSPHLLLLQCLLYHHRGKEKGALRLPPV